MRKRQHEITSRDKVDEILGRCRVGRIATHGADGYPYVIPLNYVYHDGSIYFHCARSGEKLDNLKRDSRVLKRVNAKCSPDFNLLYSR